MDPIEWILSQANTVEGIGMLLVIFKIAIDGSKGSFQLAELAVDGKRIFRGFPDLDRALDAFKQANLIMRPRNRVNLLPENLRPLYDDERIRALARDTVKTQAVNPASINLGF